MVISMRLDASYCPLHKKLENGDAANRHLVALRLRGSVTRIAKLFAARPNRALGRLDSRLCVRWHRPPAAARPPSTRRSESDRPGPAPLSASDLRRLLRRPRRFEISRPDPPSDMPSGAGTPDGSRVPATAQPPRSSAAADLDLAASQAARKLPIAINEPSPQTPSDNPLAVSSLVGRGVTFNRTPTGGGTDNRDYRWSSTADADRCAVFGTRLGQRPSELRDLADRLRPAAILQLPDTCRA